MKSYSSDSLLRDVQILHRSDVLIKNSGKNDAKESIYI